MKRIRRDLERFETLALFDAISREHGFRVDDPMSQAAFLERLSQSIGRGRSNPIVLHGRRIENMFEYVAASLRKCTLIKREDAGDIWSSRADILPPDYRLLLESGEQVFIEVKNCHKADPTYRFRLRSSYVASLLTYAELFKGELMFAVFWSRWKRWTLIGARDLATEGAYRITTMADATRLNQMARLGDLLIGTKPPLVFRVIADASKPRHVEQSGTVNFTISGVELYCNGRLIRNDREQQIAFYFMLHSDWESETPRAQIVNGELQYFEYVAEPRQRTEDQGFECLGFLSDMISRHYNELTAAEGKIAQLTPSVDPDALGVYIAENYKGEDLPLWIFSLMPPKSAADN